jgi:hypothetical protein
MAAPPKETRKLTFVDIVMNADAATIKAAYEARVEVDKLLTLREDAYRHIAEVETKVEELMGQPGLFVFPPPPLAVAGLEGALPRPRKTTRAAGGEATQAPAAAPPPAEETTGADDTAAAGTEKTPATKPADAERPAARGGSSSSRSH